jgi:hypothetical protein
MQSAFKAWQQLWRAMSSTRRHAQQLLAAVVLSVHRQRVQAGLQFWRMWTAALACDRLQLQVPVFVQPLPAFEAWLRRHQRREHLQRQAVLLATRLGLRHSLCECVCVCVCVCVCACGRGHTG